MGSYLVNLSFFIIFFMRVCVHKIAKKMIRFSTSKFKFKIVSSF